MQRSIIIFFCLLGLTVLGQNKTTAPKARDVINEFYRRYTIDILNNLGEISDILPHVAFEKRKEGWWVVTQKIGNLELETVNRYLFYDNALRRYKPLALSKVKTPKQINPAEYFDEYTLTNYDVNTYYGYKGWYKDVIKDLKDRQHLSDDELYGLGRAYSMHAGALLSDQSGDALVKEIWPLPLTINCLTPQQIEQFNLLEIKAQECFRKLAIRNPTYETIVGKIGMKYANECMFQYMTLLAYADDYAKEMKLPDSLYTAAQLETAERNLANCPANAILFSFGDNDYYPVHYLQKAKGIRTDVYIVNYSLLGMDRYIYRATLPVYSAIGIALSVDTSFYKGNRNDIIAVKDSSYCMPFNEVLEIIRTEQGNNDFKTMFANSISFTKQQNGDVTTVVKIAFNKLRYLFKNDWVLLDIINNLNGRKICFPNRFKGTGLQGLDDFLVARNGLYIYDN